MSMGTLGRVMRTSRTQMIAATAERVADDFYEHFGMRDGDYIEYQRQTTHGTKTTLGRIMMVECCFYNSGDGWTASVKVAPLLMDGTLGNTKSIYLVMSSKRKLTDLRGETVTRVTDSN